jgi:hypothetical protein
MRHTHARALLRTFAPLSLLLAATACDTFDPAPVASLAGAEEGALPVGAPLVVAFSEPVAADSLDLLLASYVTDGEENLADEDDDPETELPVLLTLDPKAGAQGGAALLASDNQSLRLEPDEALPAGPALVVVVEPGLRDREGNATRGRQRLKFAYGFDCSADAASPTEPVAMPSGPYFLLVDVDDPVQTQVQLWAWLDIDPATGKVRGKFSNADRLDHPGACPEACSKVDVCKLLPSPACVPQSDKASEVDEHPDWLSNYTPPTGYTFLVDGCARPDGSGGVSFATEPVDTVTQSPPITNQAVTMSGVLREVGGDWKGTGSFAVGQVILGETPSGAGKGSLRMTSVPVDEAPPDLPRP